MMILTQSKADTSRLFSRIRACELTRAFSMFVLLVIAWELAGIWMELKGVRTEQVKNAFYALSPQQVERLRSQSDREAVKNYSRLLASEIAGIDRELSVKIDEPVNVEIGNQPVDVEIER